MVFCVYLMEASYDFNFIWLLYFLIIILYNIPQAPLKKTSALKAFGYSYIKHIITNARYYCHLLLYGVKQWYNVVFIICEGLYVLYSQPWLFFNVC